MLTHPQIDPVALALGPVKIHWYGLMYVLAFVLFVVLGRLHAKRRADLGYNAEAIEDLMFYGMLGVILGGRVGYILFYKLSHYLANPIEVLYVWQGGMSFHGGFLGVLVAMWWWGQKHDRSFFEVTDFIAPLVPTGLAAGRLGNFINQELPGRITDASVWPWAMWFPAVDTQPVARHPSSLYNFLGEGVMLFALLWLVSKKPRAVGVVSAWFLLGYGGFRFFAEYAREPDVFLGFQALGLTRGQWLCVPMIAAGVAILVLAKKGAFTRELRASSSAASPTAPSGTPPTEPTQRQRKVARRNKS
jgi:phosphatidylglycerol---prolipoprotein diacylglyceryl transferase